VCVVHDIDHRTCIARLHRLDAVTRVTTEKKKKKKKKNLKKKKKLQTKAMFDVVWLKVVAGLCIVTVQTLFVLLPRFLEFRKCGSFSFDDAAPFVNAFSGGLMFATAVIHLLGESIHASEVLVSTAVPLSSLLFCASYLLSWLVFGHLLPLAKCCAHHHAHHGAAHVHPAPDRAPLVSSGARSVASSGDLLSADTSIDQEALPSVRAVSQPGLDDAVRFHDRTHLGPGLILVGALCFHSLFSGLVLGFCVTFGAALTVFLALLGHKWGESLALGSVLVSNFPGISWLRLSFFASLPALCTSLGLLIGALTVTSVTEDVQLSLSCIASALSGGLFLYISLNEVLIGEFLDKKRWIFKFLACCLGFTVMSLLSAFLVD
jgi:zinc transporter 1/2/3